MLRPERTAGVYVATALCLLAGAGRLICGDELMLAAADQVCAAHSTECFSQDGPVVRIVVPQEGFVQSADLQSLRYADFFTRA